MLAPISYEALKVGSSQLELAPTLKPVALSKSEEGLTFKQLLGGMVEQVDTLQKTADTSIKELAMGKRSDVHNIAIQMDEAGVAFDLMMQIRNKLVDAYKEISRIQS